MHRLVLNVSLKEMLILCSQLPVKEERLNGVVCKMTAPCLAPSLSKELLFCNFKLPRLRDHKSKEKVTEINLFSIKKSINIQRVISYKVDDSIIFPTNCDFFYTTLNFKFQKLIKIII